MARGFVNGVLEVQFSVWAPTADFANVRTAATIAIDRKLRACGIELTATTSDLSLGASLPVQLLPEVAQSETLSP